MEITPAISREDLLNERRIERNNVSSLTGNLSNELPHEAYSSKNSGFPAASAKTVDCFSDGFATKASSCCEAAICNGVRRIVRKFSRRHSSIKPCSRNG